MQKQENMLWRWKNAHVEASGHAVQMTDATIPEITWTAGHQQENQSQQQKEGTTKIFCDELAQHDWEGNCGEQMKKRDLESMEKPEKEEEELEKWGETQPLKSWWEIS